MMGTLPKPLVDIECLEYNEGIIIVGGKTGKHTEYDLEMAKTVNCIFKDPFALCDTTI